MRLIRLTLVLTLGIASGLWLSQPAAASHAVTHTVGAGDTLSQIAAEYDTSVGALVALNEARCPRLAESGGRTILVGWELVVEPGPGELRWQALLRHVRALIEPWRLALSNVPRSPAVELQPASQPNAVQPASSAPSVDEIEASLVAQTNAARANAGLPALQMDATLMALARQRSQDMVDRGYFSHKDPETGGSMVWPYCIEPLNVEFCGENIAGATSLADAQANTVNRWMASDGHRENILRPQFGRIGIGIAVGGQWGVIATQLFAP